MKLSKRARTTLTILAFLIATPILVVCGLFVWDKFTPSVARRALPASATDIQESYDDSGPFSIQGDFARYLKARMPESEMPAFAAKLGLTQQYSAATYSKIPITFSGETAWWNPSETMDGAYIKVGPGSEAYLIVKYENGWVYFKAISGRTLETFLFGDSLNPLTESPAPLFALLAYGQQGERERFSRQDHHSDTPPREKFTFTESMAPCRERSLLT